MIELQTGLPGACKTLYTIDRIERLRRESNRPVFYSGIKGLTLPWEEIPAEDWWKCPPESVVVIDEAQRLFRPRANGSQVPKYESELETHRHGGIDLILITQHERLINYGVRTLVGRHFHAVRKFGMQWSTIYEWPEVKGSDKRKDAVEHQYRFSKEVFDWYKSAEVHTVKRRIPMRVWVLLGAVVLAPVLGWWGFHAARGIGGHKPGGVGVDAAASAVGGYAAGVKAKTAAEYVVQFVPRVPGLDYTAPVYDKVTEPVDAPYPAACLSMGTRCECYSQQATRLQVPLELCKSIAKGGFFVAWQRGARGEQAQAVQAIPGGLAAQPIAPLPLQDQPALSQLVSGRGGRAAAGQGM